MNKRVLFLITLILLTVTNSLLAQGTAFTYQGQLSSNGVPLNGHYDFEFSLYPNAGGTGSPLGTGTLTQTALGVTNGLFTTTLGFGAVFTGNATWLAISVRSNNVGSYTALTPLQELNPTPYAIYTPNAGSAATATTAASFSGSLAGDVTGPQSATVVATVGGVTAANVASGANAANAAPSANTAGTIVKRDSSDNFTAGTVTANLVGNGSGVTSLNASQLTSGVIPLAQLPAAVVTNNETGVALVNLTLTSNLNLPSPATINSAGNSLLYSDGNNNFYAGPGAGSLTNAGGANTGIGSGALQNNTNGTNNTAIGYQSLDNNTNGSFNTASGERALFNNTSGNDNTAVGRHALEANTSGSNNTAHGYNALLSTTSGSSNIALGYQAGDNFKGNESSNIDIGNPGVQGENNIIRIGSGQASTFIAGVITGNGSGLTNVNAVALANGTGIGSGTNNTVGSGNMDSYIGGGSNNTVSSDYSTVGGGRNNTIETNSEYSTIGGGNDNTIETNSTSSTIVGGDENMIQSNSEYSTIVGGEGNTIQANANTSTIGGDYNEIQAYANESTISGGYDNTIQTNAANSTIAGGTFNVIDSTDFAIGIASGSTIGGGYENTIQTNAQVSTIGGGIVNAAGGYASTVPGGYQNTASADYSFAAGNNAQATNNGAFVWSDGTGTSTTTFKNDQFMVRASGGVVLLTSTAASPTSYATGSAGAALLPNATSWTTVSDRNVKKNFQPVNTRALLEKLAAIPIQQWNYKWEQDSDVPNIGPMAQDFKAAFYPGRDDKGISTLEFDGVELAAIQGLNQKLEVGMKAKDAKITSLEKEISDLKSAQQQAGADWETRFQKLEKAIAAMAVKTSPTLAVNNPAKTAE